MELRLEGIKDTFPLIPSPVIPLPMGEGRRSEGAQGEGASKDSQRQFQVAALWSFCLYLILTKTIPNSSFVFFEYFVVYLS